MARPLWTPRPGKTGRERHGAGGERRWLNATRLRQYNVVQPHAPTTAGCGRPAQRPQQPRGPHVPSERHHAVRSC